MPKKPKQSKPKPSSAKPPSSEDMMKNLHRILSEQDFQNMDQANAFLQDLLQKTGGHLPQMPAQSDLDRAQDIMYDAWENPNRTQRIKLARKALSISQDCADAYLLLGEQSTKNPQEAISFYVQGVEAGRRALGNEFEELVGHFWGVIETRPYMRCRLALANALWATGKLEEASEHMQEMLKLNPNDNQGVRDLLSCLLIETGDDKAFENLLKMYPERWGAYMLYSEALWMFRNARKGKKAVKALEKALNYNSFVPDFLLGRKKMPRQTPGYYSPGDESEAINYVLIGQPGWQMTEGALDWLRTFVDV